MPEDETLSDGNEVAVEKKKRGRPAKDKAGVYWKYFFSDL